MRRIVVLFFAQVRRGKIGQKVGKVAFRLHDQRVSVGKEQDVSDPPLLQKNVAQSDHRPRLPGAGRHDQQRLAAVLFIKSVADRLDRRLLIVPSGDLPLDRHV